MMQPPLNRKIKVVGCDPSLRNWGLAVGMYDLDTQTIKITDLALVSPVLSTGKRVRVNSLDLESATQLYKHTAAMVSGAHAIFVEVPVGSQSARAMASYGICVGVLGSLIASGHPLFELTPTEVKLAGHGTATATKLQMIQWATGTHPQANWPMHKVLGKLQVTESKAEHLADATAAIHAGVSSKLFRQLLSLTAQP